jgi:hypothetical protein
MAVNSEGNDFRARYADYKMEFHRKCSIDPIKPINSHQSTIQRQSSILPR